jgi:NTE family protein
MLGGWNLDASPAYVMFDLVTRIASLYDNPFNLNPLKDLSLSNWSTSTACGSRR